MASVLRDIADNLDGRRTAVGKVRRIIASLEGHLLEATAVEMSIPFVYAQWEGFAKESCALYLRHVESAGILLRELREELLAYAWSLVLCPTQSKLSWQQRCDVVRRAQRDIDTPLAVPTPLLTVNVQSNLGFEALESLCRDLGLGPPPGELRQRLNALVHMRNNIAHGASPTALSRARFEQHAETALEAMGILELLLGAAVSGELYRRTDP